MSLALCREALSTAQGDLATAKRWLSERDWKEDAPESIHDLEVPGDAPEQWPYLINKARLYLKIADPAIYRKQDPFGMPKIETSLEILEEIERCFRQFSAGRGYKDEQPVEGISTGDSTAP